LSERLAEGLAEGLAEVQVVDVREPAEFTGALGHIEGARLLPLGELATRSAELDRSRPVVTVCRSGTRSAQAALLLGKAGFGAVANLAGGMLRWRTERFPAPGAAD
jgi:rhodanese-related sulfurtransferase